MPSNPIHSLLSQRAPTMSLPYLTSTLGVLLTWRTAFLVLFVANLKSIPFAWHIRLLYRLFTNLRRSRPASPSSTPHPIFTPTSITSHSPLYECDYNIHKSNSTYFSDLDESRTALVTRIYGPALSNNDRSLEQEGHKGRLAVILGSVHCSFHREIKPYERYEVRSRVLGWDRKWLVIGSWFVKRRKGGEVVLASALSKYVVKKGRFTVSPERCLAGAGWFDGMERGDSVGEKGGEGELQSPKDGDGDGDGEGLGDSVSESLVDVTGRVMEGLEKVVSRDQGKEHEQTREGWSWSRIEEERLRGLKTVEGWLSLDGDLMQEFSHIKA